MQRYWRACINKPSVELAVEVARTHSELLALADDYAHLQQVTRNQWPFALHDWHVAWAKHLLHSGAQIQAELIVHVLRTPAGNCIGIVPLIRTRRGFGAVTVTSIDLIGADPAITEVRTSLIEPGYELEVSAAVQSSLRRMRPFDWVSWRAASASLLLAAPSGTKIQKRAALAVYILDLPASWDSLRAGLKRNIRESIRHCYNSLQREHLAFEIRTAKLPGEVRPALDRFFELHTARALNTQGVVHPDHFKSTAARSFLYEVCERLVTRGQVRIVEMLIDSKVVATRIVFVVGNAAYLYYSGYDSRWSKYGVMTTTVTEIIKSAIEEGLDSINFSTGKDVSKTRWGPREVLLEEVVQISPSLFSRLAWIAYRTATATAGESMPNWVAWLPRRLKRQWA